MCQEIIYARARAQTETDEAPAFLRTAAHSETVAPVVMISSTRSMFFPLRSVPVRALKTPLTFSCLSSLVLSVDWTLFLARLKSSLENGIPVSFESSPAISSLWSNPLLRLVLLLTGTQVIRSKSSLFISGAISAAYEDAFALLYENFRSRSEERTFPSYLSGTNTRSTP